MKRTIIAICLISIVFAQQEPLPWPDTFSVYFQTYNESSVQSVGYLFYDWTIQSQRIDHSAGAYECVHFYKTNGPCSLIFNEKGMWVWIESEQRCCLDLPGIGAAVPDWMQNGTYIGTDDVLGNECTHWENVHQYWSLVSNPSITCKFAFPNNPTQDMYFDLSTYEIGPQDPDLFILPPYCKPSCQ